MFRKKNSYIKSLSEQSDDSGTIAEFNYLNAKTMMRIDTTHYIWIGSIVAEGVLIGHCLECKNGIVLCGSIVLMIPFVLSMAFQLQRICKIRTYVAIFICPKLGISYDKSWPSFTGKKDYERGIFGMRPVSYILLLPYFIYSFLSLLLSLSFSHDPSANVDLTYLINLTSSELDIIAIWFIANGVFLVSAKILLKSLSIENWDQYYAEWKARKEAEEKEYQTNDLNNQTGQSLEPFPS